VETGDELEETIGRVKRFQTDQRRRDFPGGNFRKSAGTKSGSPVEKFPPALWSVCPAKPRMEDRLASRAPMFHKEFG
jgi:hypothetical protein